MRDIKSSLKASVGKYDVDFGLEIFLFFNTIEFRSVRNGA